jgi:hypothetical protein
MGLLELLAVVAVVLWLGGFALHVGGGLINILLLVAVVLFVSRFFRSRTV